MKEWKKILAINLFVFILILLLIEIAAGISRTLIGKVFHIPFKSFFVVNNDINGKGSTHPCIENQTDTLLGHRPYTRNKCIVKGGKIIDDYVIYGDYDINLPTILTLGGSTTSGIYGGFSNGDTWPYLLSVLLKQNYNIINGGLAGYDSSQEFYKLSRDLDRFRDIALVISLNGINESRSNTFNDINRNYLHPFFEKNIYKMNRKQIWIDTRVSSSLRTIFPNTMSAVDHIKRILFFHISEYENTSKNEPPKIAEFFKPINAVERWEINVKRMYHLSKARGVPYIVFLQPTMGLEHGQNKATINTSDYNQLIKLEKTYIKEINELYKKLKIRCKKMYFCIDISHEAGPSGNNYNNPRHHNSNGNKIIL
jgi:hypothetical protein